MAKYHIETLARDAAKHFVIAAVWADCEDGTNPKPTASAHVAALAICKAFITRHWALVKRAIDARTDGYGSHPDCGKEGAAGALGHDLWLTMRGHGVGFWDRDALEADGLGDALTEACKAFGEPEYWQERGWFYIDTNGMKGVTA